MNDDELLARRAARLARPTTASVQGRPAMVVAIGAQQYAFPLDEVRRAAVLGSLTRLPHVPPIVLGLGTLDGEVVAVFDGAVWAGGPPRVPTERTPVLVLGTSTAPLVLAVDAFASSVVLPAHVPPSATWLQFITDDGVLAVDVPTLLSDPVFSPRGAADDRH